MYNILICDDEKDIVSALSIYLSTENYNIFTAYTGKEALDVVSRNDIHLILMDIMMPQMDGIAATAKLRETSNIPIILLTAKSEDTDKILGLNIGADDYITKPFNPVEVMARVRSQLRRYTSLGGIVKKASQIVIGSIVLDDGLFLACESRLKHKAVMRSNFSSAVAGNEGLFNLGIQGNGILCLESECPREELVEIVLENDVLKVDGNMAIAWSGSLDFTVERSGKSLIGSAASGEGLVNVYRGTGKVLLAPVAKGIV